MSEYKEIGREVADRLHATIDYSDYMALRNAIDDIEPLEERDRILEDLWEKYGDIPMNPETECIEESFLDFPAGTSRYDILHWFDERYRDGVYYLMYRPGPKDRRKITDLLYYNGLCFDCTTNDCAYNSAGECRYPMVHHRCPIITDDGCVDGVIDFLGGDKE